MARRLDGLPRSDFGKLRRKWMPIQEEDYLKIPLSKGEFAIIDKDDFDKIKSYSWHVWCNGRIKTLKYAVNAGSRIKMHRIIMDCPKDKEVDHINGNGLDNRKDNLRICDHFNNLCNVKMWSSNTSGYKGVTWDKVNNKWIAQIGRKGKNIKIGRYNTIEEAYKERLKYAKVIQGGYINE